MMTRQKRKFVEAVWFSVLLAVVFSGVYIQKQIRETRLKKEHVFTFGKVKGVVIRAKSSALEYEYLVGYNLNSGRHYKFSRKSHEKYQALKDIDFKVIYEPSCPDNSALLLRKEDYQEYGIPLDSMGNVIDFY